MQMAQISLHAKATCLSKAEEAEKNERNLKRGIKKGEKKRMSSARIPEHTGIKLNCRDKMGGLRLCC
jgi:hypothetical protein